FEFQTGSMTKVWREIPLSRTDGIDIVDASMDGRAIAPAIRRGARLRVEWQFPPTAPSTHTFVLHYIVHGVVYRESDRDVLRWCALPIEHAYTIDATRITVHASEPDADPPRAEAHRAVLHYARAIPSGGIDIEAGPVRSNGWIVADVRFGAARVAAVPPEWQARQDSAAALGPRWAIAGGAMFVLGVFVIVIARQRYPSPSIRPDETAATDPPSDVPAAVAAVLANNGRCPAHAAPTTLIDLADRGVLTIRELPRTLGVRNFEISQVPGAHDLAGHETMALMTGFGGGSEPVTLAKARARLARSGRSYRAALTADLIEHGFVEPERKAVRDRVRTIGVALLLAGVCAVAGAAALVPAFGAWTFFAPAGLILAGFIGMMMAVTMTPLTDAALVEAARWRGYRRHLKAVAADPDLQAPQGLPSRWIIYGVALGLAHQWSRYLRKHPDAAPRWCVTLQDDDGGAFAALIGNHSATATSGGGAAAGGGSSGAA
ncbi:MAG TPA: hypothetical protein VH138_09065, partial [Vicinamibacterales bacterium]|nr:hypothetical protein [Vicinamibacterales bacterium]